MVATSLSVVAVIVVMACFLHGSAAFVAWDDVTAGRRRSSMGTPAAVPHGSARERSAPASPLTMSSSSSSSASDEDGPTSPSPPVGGGGTTERGDDNPGAATAAAGLLRERARKLREEVDAFERRRFDADDAERERLRRELDDRQAAADRCSVVVPVLRADGSTVEERVRFPPRLEEAAGAGTGLASEVVLCGAPLPLGVLLGEHDSIAGMTVVDEVLAGSNGEAAGVREGDLLRACTACKMEMEQPTWQLIAGGIGRPKTARFMFSADFKPFEQVMEAVASNRMDPEGRPVLLVLERSIQPEQ